MSFTVVIATYNRPHLLERAIRSVVAQDVEGLEIIVVDDASDPPVAFVVERYPGVRYLRQERNTGPGPARNRGIEQATRGFVIILDDDDELLPGALRLIQERISSFAEDGHYPVFQFSHGNGVLNEPFRVVRFSDYQTGVLRGDFLPVIDRHSFLELGYAYPDLRIGAEHLLWWEIAQRFGIPTWSERVCVIHDDAPIRLTSPLNQLARAPEYAEMQEITLARFGNLLKEQSPASYRVRKLGAATYWLLAGERERARRHLGDGDVKGGMLACALWCLSFLPGRLARWAFLMYRRISA